jgi:hypothetical protein
MKTNILFCLFFTLINSYFVIAQNNDQKNSSPAFDYITAFKDTLTSLSGRTDNEFFKMHCNAIVSVINSKTSLNSRDSGFLINTCKAFNNQSDTANAKDLKTYLSRQRPLILSWVSPTDGAVSFSWLNPPKDWDTGKKYPLYIQLHGLWSVASNSIEYLTYPFLQNASSDSSFEDGYLLSPWGRGNLWYEGISETDIWECIDALESRVKTDPYRKYLSGHSMGGYGAWKIGSGSPETWAALGIHAGALGYNNNHLVNADVATKLKDIPVYFVCGTNDGLLGINQTAYNLLEDAGDQNLEFVTFTGGHDYIEENVENMYLWMRNFINEDINTGTGKITVSPSHESQIRCYPNPATTISNIVYPAVDGAVLTVVIYDMYGNLIDGIATTAQHNGEDSFAYNTTNLASGIYFVHLQSCDWDENSKMVVLK